MRPGAFGSTQCRELTACDFATAAGVHAYVEHAGIAQCAELARRVAERVAATISAAPGAGVTAAPGPGRAGRRGGRASA